MTRKLQKNAVDLLGAAERVILLCDYAESDMRNTDCMRVLRAVVDRCREPLHVDNSPEIPFSETQKNRL